MRRARHRARDTVVWAVLTGGIVALVLGQTIIGLVVLAFGLWQVILIGTGRGGLFVDQRVADKPGRPTLR